MKFEGFSKTILREDKDCVMILKKKQGFWLQIWLGGWVLDRGLIFYKRVGFFTKFSI